MEEVHSCCFALCFEKFHFGKALFGCIARGDRLLDGLMAGTG
jgi:hypothetical protein